MEGADYVERDEVFSVSAVFYRVLLGVNPPLIMSDVELDKAEFLSRLGRRHHGLNRMPPCSRGRFAGKSVSACLWEIVSGGMQKYRSDRPSMIS
jgi:hypothetical protein